MKKTISVILPCFNEAKNIPLLIPEIIKNIPSKYGYEIVCVDDGSFDQTKNEIKRLSKVNKNIKGVLLYRRFGHQQALRAGIDYSKGDAVVMMDADFQHSPKLIPKFIGKWEQGCDLVGAKKIQNKNAGILRNIGNKIAYRLWSMVSNGIIVPGISDFRLISREIADYVKQNHEEDIFVRGLVNLAAKKPCDIPYNTGRRKYGESAYNNRDLIELFINGFVSFSTKPLRVAFILGITIFTITGLFLLVDLIQALMAGRKIIEGWLTTVYLTFLANSLILIYLGVLGEYIGVIFRETKKRPSYFIDKTINLRPLPQHRQKLFSPDI